MPSYKAIRSLGLGGLLFLAAEKVINTISHYGENAAPIPERPARYTPAVLPTLSSHLSSTLLPVPNMPQNATTSVMMSTQSLADSSKTSQLWTMILSLWSLFQATAHFLTEHYSELIADLTVQLVFCVAVYYLGDHFDQALTRLLRHTHSPPADHRVEQETSRNSSYIRIHKATIRVLLELADKIQCRITNMEATIANIYDEGKQKIQNLWTELAQARKTINDLCTELGDAKKTNTALKRKLEETTTQLQDSRSKAHDIEVELERISAEYRDAVEDSETKIEEAEKNFQNVERELVEAAEKIAVLQTNLECMVEQHEKAAKDKQTEAKTAQNRITQLQVQAKNWENQFNDSEATTADKIEKAVQIAKKNAETVTERKLEMARVGTEAEIIELKAKIAALSTTKKPAQSFNPTAEDFTPQTSLPTTPFPPSPSPLPPTSHQQTIPPAAPSPQSPSPLTRAPHQLPTFQKQPLTGEPKRVVDGINAKLNEEKRRKMIGLPIKGEETAPLSAEEVARRLVELDTPRRPSQQVNPTAPAFTPRSALPLPIQPVPSPAPSAPELGRRMQTPDMTGPSPTLSAPELGPTADMTGQRPPTHPATATPPPPPPPPPTGPSHLPTPPQHRPHRGVKPGAPGTPALTWAPAPPPLVANAPTAPRAMRLPGRPAGALDNCFVQPRPRPNARGRGNYGGPVRGSFGGPVRGTFGGPVPRERPQLPPHLRGNVERRGEGGAEGGAE